MTRWGNSDRGGPAERRVDAEAREAPARPPAPSGRSAAAPVLLALTTVVGLLGAVLALLPAAVTRRPAGRLGPRSTPADADGAADGEPLAR